MRRRNLGNGVAGKPTNENIEEISACMCRSGFDLAGVASNLENDEGYRSMFSNGENGRNGDQ